MAVSVRNARITDAEAIGAAWRDAGGYYGAGAALLTAAEAWGREHGARIVRLDTYAHSPVSVPFYEQRMGYQRRAIVFEKPLLPHEM